MESLNFNSPNTTSNEIQSINFNINITTLSENKKQYIKRCLIHLLCDPSQYSKFFRIASMINLRNDLSHLIEVKLLKDEIDEELEEIKKKYIKVSNLVDRYTNTYDYIKTYNDILNKKEYQTLKSQIENIKYTGSLWKIYGDSYYSLPEKYTFHEYSIYVTPNDVKVFYRDKRIFSQLNLTASFVTSREDGLIILVDENFNWIKYRPLIDNEENVTEMLEINYLKNVNHCFKLIFQPQTHFYFSKNKIILSKFTIDDVTYLNFKCNTSKYLIKSTHKRKGSDRVMKCKIADCSKIKSDLFNYTILHRQNNIILHKGLITDYKAKLKNADNPKLEYTGKYISVPNIKTTLISKLYDYINSDTYVERNFMSKYVNIDLLNTYLEEVQNTLNNN